MTESTNDIGDLSEEAVGALADFIVADAELRGDEPAEQTWDTTQLQQDFTVIGFQAPYVVVVRKADGVKGSLEFTHAPRVYRNFQAVS